jgi:prepilin-type processing-associated H-X9-DG protein
MLGMAVLNESSVNHAFPYLKYDPQGRVLHSWQTAIRYFTLEGRILGDIDLERPWDDPRNSAYFRAIMTSFLNPEVGTIRDGRGCALSHYAGNQHVFGRRTPLRPEDVSNGASNTIMAGEVADEFKPWGDPTNLRDPIRGINQSPQGFGGPSGTGANMIFLDGSVRFLRNTTSPKALQPMSFPVPPRPVRAD